MLTKKGKKKNQFHPADLCALGGVEHDVGAYTPRFPAW